jgi:hypothetical protein
MNSNNPLRRFSRTLGFSQTTTPALSDILQEMDLRKAEKKRR